MGKTLRRNAAGDCDEVLAPLHPAISTSAFVLTLIALLVGGVGATFAEESVPVNATEKRYANGWTCDPGYQENEGACDPREGLRQHDLLGTGMGVQPRLPKIIGRVCGCHHTGQRIPGFQAR